MVIQAGCPDGKGEVNDGGFGDVNADDLGDVSDGRLAKSEALGVVG